MYHLGVVHKETLSNYKKTTTTLTVLKAVFAMSNIFSEMKTICCSGMYLFFFFFSLSRIQKKPEPWSIITLTPFN